jgi:hypothetical protein
MPEQSKIHRRRRLEEEAHAERVAIERDGARQVVDDDGDLSDAREAEGGGRHAGFSLRATVSLAKLLLSTGNY